MNSKRARTHDEKNKEEMVKIMYRSILIMSEHATRVTECNRVMPCAGGQFLARQVSKKAIATS